MTAARGGSAWPARRGSDSRVNFPLATFCRVSSDGVAEPSTTGAAGALRAQDREIARRVAKAALLLLERGVVFLVDDHDAEIRDRREHRRARAEHDARLARQALAPGRQPLGVGQRGVQQRQRHGEALAEARHQLRRETDLRHQHQRALSAPQRVLDRVQIDLGLAAAGDAVEQERREPSLRRVDRGDRRRSVPSLKRRAGRA